MSDRRSRKKKKETVNRDEVHCKENWKENKRFEGGEYKSFYINKASGACGKLGCARAPGPLEGLTRSGEVHGAPRPTAGIILFGSVGVRNAAVWTDHRLGFAPRQPPPRNPGPFRCRSRVQARSVR